MKHIFTVLFAAAFFACTPANAQQNDDEINCEDIYRAEIFNTWDIVKSMADFKAGFDAGYEACATHLPEDYADTQQIHDEWQDKTTREMEQAHTIIDHMMDNTNTNDIPQQCADDHEALKTVREQSHNAIDQQYKKAYDRRMKSAESFKELSEEQVNETCTGFLEMVTEHYKDKPDLTNILFTLSRKLNNVLNGLDWDKRRAYKNYEKTHKSLFSETP